MTLQKFWIIWSDGRFTA